MSSSSGSGAGAAPQLFLTSELFTSAGLDSRVWKCLSGMRLSRMSAVQAQAIPVLLGGSNAIVKAKTGSGKTLAYAVPLVQQILLEQEANPDEQKRELSRIVLLPTHELCEQVRSTIQSLLKFCSDCVKVVALKADAGSPAQTRALNEAQIREASPNILVATPAQLLAYCKDSERSASAGRKGGAASGTASLKASLRHLVLDEADLVLGMGYESELGELLSNKYLGHGFQISLFSATLDPQIENLRNLYLGDRAQTVVVEDASSGPDGQPKLSQFYLTCPAQDKYMLAYAFLQLGVIDKARRVLFFISNIADAYRLKLFLGHFSVRAAVLNHELPYNSRQNILEQFNRGLIDILIATDEAAGEAEDEAVESKRAQKRNKGNKRTASALKEEDEEEEEDAAVKDEDEDEDDEDEPASKKSKTASGAAATQKKKQQGSKPKLEEDETMGVKDEDEAQLDADVEALAKLDKATPAPVRTKGRKGRAGPGGAALGSANVSRGVDFKDVGTVVNFDFPRSVKNYIHRVGRTARADRAGVALSFVSAGEEPLLQAVLDTQIERSVRMGALPEQAQAQLQALPFDTRAVDAFRYRCSDKMRAVTTLAIREERLSQIKAELVNSDKLRAHWEDNPRELNLLKHDRVLRNARIQKHLATVPAYLLPEGMTPADANAAAPSAAANDAKRNKLRRNKHKSAINAGNKAKKLGLDKVKGIAGARAKGRHTMATKNATDPLRSFRAKPIAANAFSASSSSAGAAKAKVDF